jgi:hypothetical protein
MSLLNNILGVSAYWQVNKDLAKKIMMIIKLH